MIALDSRFRGNDEADHGQGGSNPGLPSEARSGALAKAVSRGIDLRNLFDGSSTGSCAGCSAQDLSGRGHHAIQHEGQGQNGQ